MPTDLEIEARGEKLVLLPERAVYWPKRQALLVADAHFGKAAGTRTAVAPTAVRSTTTEYLARLDRALARHPAKQVIFLGDFLHAETGREPNTFEALEAWRGRRPEFSLLLVRGSRDTHAGDPPATLGFEIVDEPFPLDPFALCHEPAEAVRRYAIGGHLHPVFALRGRANERLRLPCFWFSESFAVLPAFGSFTGGYQIQRRPGDRVYLIAENEVLSVQPA